jgi:hypothetical protein
MGDHLLGPAERCDRPGRPALPGVVVGHDAEPVDDLADPGVVVHRPVGIGRAAPRADGDRQQLALGVERRAELGEEGDEARGQLLLLRRRAAEVHRLVVEVDAVEAAARDEGDDGVLVPGPLRRAPEHRRHRGRVEGLGDGRQHGQAQALELGHDCRVGAAADRGRPGRGEPERRDVGPEVPVGAHRRERCAHVRSRSDPAVDDAAWRGVGGCGRRCGYDEAAAEEDGGEEADEQRADGAAGTSYGAARRGRGRTGQHGDRLQGTSAVCAWKGALDRGAEPVSTDVGGVAGPSGVYSTLERNDWVRGFCGSVST